MKKTFLTTKDTKVTKEKCKSKVFLKPFVYVVPFVFKAFEESRHD